MANSAFHKKQAEALIIEANKLRNRMGIYWREDYKVLVDLAAVHASLARVPDMEEE